MGLFIMVAALFWLIQFCFCHCKYKIVRFIPLLPVVAFFIWVEMTRNPAPGCGLGGVVEWLAIGVCLAGIALGWLTYGIEIMFKK